MKFKLYIDVALSCDVPKSGLKRGDVVKLVDHHVAPDGTERKVIPSKFLTRWVKPLR